MTTRWNYPDPALQDELRKMASILVTHGKGILAADDSAEDMGKRFSVIGLDNTEDHRRKYWQLLFTTCPTISEYLSGVILYADAFNLTADDGTPFSELLKRRGIIPGVTVDTGEVPLFGSLGEFTTQGLDELSKRCSQHKKEGFYFAKWRCVFKVSEHTPSLLALQENAKVLARYASICQANRLVPIVEPEVLIQGDHDIERTQKVTETVLAFVYKALADYNVFLEGTILKTNMVTAGQGYKGPKNTPEQVAAATVAALSRRVPAAVPGVMFLSGGQSAEDATVNLNAINQFKGKKPWPLSFCFGRALQAKILPAWLGKEDNVLAGQAELLKSSKANSEASLGKYIPGSV